MAKVQALPALNYGPSRGSSSGGGGALPNEFPAGMRILVVDDDLICLNILRRMLTECLYEVTTCCRATAALSLLREKKGGFDVVLSDVHMPGMDGFELLELVGIEMNIPVIMISADGRTSAVMSGITRGACDYLIKPVRMEELRNIWQHVVRKKRQGNKERSDSLEDFDCNRQVTDDADHDSVNYGSDGPLKSRRKKRETGENDDDELDNGDPSSKKARVVWSVELHRQFVDAVNQLGIDKAVPKKILELMNVPGITRENVASHLQKYRMYLRRLSGVALHLRGLPDSLFGAAVANTNAQLLDSLGFPALSASGPIPPQTLAALEAELLRQSSGSLAVSAMGQPSFQQASVQVPNRIPVEQGAILGQPLMNFQTNMSNRFPQSNIAGSSDNLGVLNSYRHGISMPPSCLVGPSQPLNSFRMGDNPILLNQNLMVAPSRALENSPVLMNRNSIVVPSQSPSSFQAENALIPRNINTGYNDVSTNFDFGLLSSQSKNLALDIGQGLGENITISNIQESGMVAGTLPNQGPGGSSGFLGEDNCNPDEYLVDDIAPPIDNLSQRNIPMGDEGESEEARDLLEFYRQS